MSRLSIDLPELFDFSIELPIVIGNINRGDHLGNEALIGFLNEARIRFLAACGVDELARGDYLFINADLAVIYQSEGRYGEVLRLEVAATQFHKYGCDIVYRVTEAVSGRAIALAKTAHLMFDPAVGKPVLAPASLHQKLASPRVKN